jgi:hypothetical protein
MNSANGNASSAPHVYQAICAITAIMAKEGISKGRTNLQQNYKFRGIDDVYQALSGHLAANSLCMLPRVVERTALERATKSGGVSTYTILLMEFDLVSAIDGSKHTIRTVGEAMDTADKSSNKAQSAATKYACLIAFQIPTEGDNDADAHTHDLAPSLAQSVDANWPKYEERHVAALTAAKTKGELQEAWNVVYESARKVQAPAEVFKRLSAAKEAAKAAFA